MEGNVGASEAMERRRAGIFKNKSIDRIKEKYLYRHLNQRNEKHYGSRRPFQYAYLNFVIGIRLCFSNCLLCLVAKKRALVSHAQSLLYNSKTSIA